MSKNSIVRSQEACITIHEQRTTIGGLGGCPRSGRCPAGLLEAWKLGARASRPQRDAGRQTTRQANRLANRLANCLANCLAAEAAPRKRDRPEILCCQGPRTGSFLESLCLTPGFGFIALLVVDRLDWMVRGGQPTPEPVRQPLARRSGRSPALPYPPTRWLRLRRRVFKFLSMFEYAVSEHQQFAHRRSDGSHGRSAPCDHSIVERFDCRVEAYRGDRWKIQDAP